MKILLKTLLLTLAVSVNASDHNIAETGGINMHQMAAQMQKMQQCLMQVDESELRRYENKINKLQPELKQLCKVGKRDEAQKKAIVFGKEVAASDAIKVVQECTKNMQLNAFMPTLPDFDNLGDRHVCDEINNY